MIGLTKTFKFSVFALEQQPDILDDRGAKTRFESVCESIDYERAREASKQERDVMNAAQSSTSNLTYGEVEYDSLRVIFERIREFGGLQYHQQQQQQQQQLPEDAGEGCVFVDLGSGCGRPVVAAAVLHPQFTKIVGVEILKGLYGMSLEAQSEWNKLHVGANEAGRLEFVLGSILRLEDYDWTRAHVLLANSTCFTIPFFDSIEKISEKCRPGTYFISLTHCLGQSNAYLHWELLDTMRLKMSWGHAEVCISRRR